MHSAVSSRWALTKFTYSSFGACVADFSCSIFISNIPVVISISNIPVVIFISNIMVIKQRPVIVYRGCCSGRILS